MKPWFRALTIAVVAPCIGMASMWVLAAARMATPQTMDKATFFLIGLAVAIASGIGLLKLWPPEIGDGDPST